MAALQDNKRKTAVKFAEYIFAYCNATLLLYQIWTPLQTSSMEILSRSNTKQTQTQRMRFPGNIRIFTTHL